MPSQRVQYELERVYPELESHTGEEFSLRCSAAILGSLTLVESLEVFLLLVFFCLSETVILGSTLFDLLNFARCQDRSTDSLDWVWNFRHWPCHALRSEQILMIDALFGGTPQPYVPEHHAPPASAHSLTLAILRRGELPTLTLAILDEGLQAHRWPELL